VERDEGIAGGKKGGVRSGEWTLGASVRVYTCALGREAGGGCGGWLGRAATRIENSSHVVADDG